MERALRAAVAGEIGVAPEGLRTAALNALWLLSRYTLLDLLDEIGLLERAVAEALPTGSTRTP